MKSTDLRPGMAVRMDGALYVITQYQHVTPGNLRAFIQVKLRRISDGTHIEKRLRSGEDVERVDLDRRKCEYLYSERAGHVFMDSQNYEQYTLADELAGEAVKFLRPNTPCEIQFAEGRPMVLDLPPTVDLVVSDTPPGIRNATATNQLKEATLETGLQTRVPPFISVGETIRVSTADGSYQSRA